MILQFLQNVGIVTFMLSIFVSIYMIFCRSYTHFNGLKKEEDELFWHAFINRLYFVLCTVATIGYGDIAPATMKARIITMCIILTIFILILKAFDSVIDSFNKNIASYVPKLTDLNPMNYISQLSLSPSTNQENNVLLQ